jgi:hypothetical protein
MWKTNSVLSKWHQKVLLWQSGGKKKGERVVSTGSPLQTYCLVRLLLQLMPPLLRPLGVP